MAVKITYRQLKILVSAFLIFLTAWLVMGHAARQGPVSIINDSLCVNISFWAPMNHARAMDHFTIYSRPGDMPVKYRSQWISRNTVRITVDESEYPRGLKYYYRFHKAPALIPPFTVSCSGTFIARLAPELVAFEPAENVPTTGPIVLIFNTPVEPGSFYRNVSVNAAGDFSPVKLTCPGETKQYSDYSRWSFKPSTKLENSQQYNINISPGLMSLGNGRLNEPLKKIFTTAPALKTREIYPEPDSPSVWLSRKIRLVTNLAIKKADIQLWDIKGMMRGKVTLANNTAAFEPDEILLPSRRYRVSARLLSEHGEELQLNYHFNTTNLGNQRWLDIKPGNPCVIKIMEGDKTLKKLEGWLSLAEDKIPRVTMYEEKRGSSLEFNPEQKNPTPYIKLNADIMLHPPPAAGGDDHGKIGLPNSYGCIYLNRDEINWIINNIPFKIMALVH
jgi:hypothetical protein